MEGGGGAQHWKTCPKACVHQTAGQPGIPRKRKAAAVGEGGQGWQGQRAHAPWGHGRRWEPYLSELSCRSAVSLAAYVYCQVSEPVHLVKRSVCTRVNWGKSPSCPGRASGRLPHCTVPSTPCQVCVPGDRGAGASARVCVSSARRQAPSLRFRTRPRVTAEDKFLFFCLCSTISVVTEMYAQKQFK